MSLLFPAYLLGFLGLALPWILHRFSDQQPPVLLFPSNQFLDATTPPVSRKRTLRYRALLALRVLSLALLCLLFAQPWINRDAVPTALQQHHMIVLDRSLSMRASGRWDEAIDRARGLIDEVGGGSAELLAFDRRVVVLASTIAYGAGESGVSLGAALDDVQPGFAPGDYGSVMQRLDRLANERELPVKVWLISDMQASALPAQLNALYAPNVAEFELLPVEGDDKLNVHLVAQAQSSNSATAQISVSLLASRAGANTSSEPVTRTVQVESSAGIIEQRSVTLTPGEVSAFSFDELVIPAESNPQFIVSLLEPDSLAEDNLHTLPIVEPQATAIVLLNGPDTQNSSAQVFVTTALETDAVAEVELLRGNAAQVPSDTAHLVTGRDVSAAVELDILQFVDTGSNALLFNTGSDSVNVSTRLEGVGVGAMDDAHPLALGEISWLGTRFFDLPPMELIDGDKLLLATADGQSVLVERDTNRGRLLILNDPLDGLASNLPLQPAFVALMQSLIRYFDASTSLPDQIVIGERLSLPVNAQIIDSTGESLVSIADRGQPASIELSEPGIYTVLSTRGEQPVRAVLEPSEADLSTLDDETTTQWQARYSDDADEATTADQAATSITSGIDTRLLTSGGDPMRHAIWQWLLPLVALLLFAEGWFANRRLDVRRDGS